MYADYSPPDEDYDEEDDEEDDEDDDGGDVDYHPMPNYDSSESENDDTENSESSTSSEGGSFTPPPTIPPPFISEAKNRPEGHVFKVIAIVFSGLVVAIVTL